MQSPRFAVFVLAFCCVCWGYSFPVTKLALEVFEAHVAPEELGNAPLAQKIALSATFNGWRFGLSALLYWLLTRVRPSQFRRSDVAGGALIGGFFSLGMLVQIVGLQYTLPSVSGFLTSLVVVFAPLAQALFFRHAVPARAWLAVGLALLGIVILSQPGAGAESRASQPPLPYLGEALTVFCAMLFTGQLLALDRYGKQADTGRLTLMVFVTAALTGVAAGLLAGGGRLYHPAVLERLAGDATLQWSFTSMVLFSSVAAVHLMNAWQPRVTPATASVVYCLEPVCAALFSIGFRMESLTAATLLGGAIILAAVLLVARVAAKIKN